MIRIEITGDSQAEIDEAMRGFVRVVDANTVQLDELLKIAQRRALESGFVLVMQTTAAPAEAAPPAVPTGPEPAPIGSDTALPLKRKRTRTASPSPPAEEEAPTETVAEAIAPAPAIVAETAPGDRDFVLEQLSQRFSDPKQKLKTKAFIDKVARRHDGVRLSLLEVGLFPAIRAEMEREFGLAAVTSGNGHAHG